VLGFRRVTVIGALFIVLAVLVVASQTRGGLMAFALPVMAVAVLAGRVRELLLVVLLTAVMLAFAYALDVEIYLGEDRNIGVRQLVENVTSIFLPTNGGLEGTKELRLDWWQTIVNYTIHGEHFWTGKGFGIDLTHADNFTGRSSLAGEGVRNPHNATMTILARAGVPGIVLWGLTLCAWGAMLLREFLVARFAGHDGAARLFLLVLGFAAAFFINASFDVALEGPMQGIWFWCLFGFGLGVAMAYRADPQLVDDQSMAAIEGR